MAPPLLLRKPGVPTPNRRAWARLVALVAPGPRAPLTDRPPPTATEAGKRCVAAGPQVRLPRTHRRRSLRACEAQGSVRPDLKAPGTFRAHWPAVCSERQ